MQARRRCHSAFQVLGEKNSVTHKFYNQDNYTLVMKEAYKHFQVKGNEKNLSLADLPLKTGWRKFLRRKGRDQVVNSRRQEGESGSGRNRKGSRCDRPSFPHEFCNPVRCLKQRCLRLTRNTMIFKSEEGTGNKASTGHPKWEMLPMGRHKYMNYTTYLYTYICLHVHTCLCMYMHKCTQSHMHMHTESVPDPGFIWYNHLSISLSANGPNWQSLVQPLSYALNQESLPSWPMSPNLPIQLCCFHPRPFP